VPAGEYQVTVWHEAVGRLGKDAGPAEVAVQAGGGTTLQYRLKPPDVRKKDGK
jgi:hypothetical protein